MFVRYDVPHCASSTGGPVKLHRCVNRGRRCVFQLEVHLVMFITILGTYFCLFVLFFFLPAFSFSFQIYYNVNYSAVCHLNSSLLRGM